jgi:Kef-type K+ transport system membrane component KefB
MEAHVFFLHLMIILLAARLFGELAVRLGAPAVLGELLAGVVVGPSLLGWIAVDDVLKLLAEVGIILLLFEVGLETDVGKLMKSGRRATFIALSGFTLPFLFGFALAYLGFGLPLLVSLFIGGTLTATSIGITIRALTDLKRHNSMEGQVVLGAAVLDDILGVVLLALLYEFSTGGGVQLGNASKILLFVVVFFLIAPSMAKLISLAIHKAHRATEIPGLIPTTIVSLVLFFAWLAHAMGVPALLGGFAAGLALSRFFFLPFGIALKTDPRFAHEIEGQMRPIVHLFTPIFFVTVGLSLNMREIDWTSAFIWQFSLGMLALAVGGKILGALLLREDWKTRWRIGVAMVPRGEVGLIFAELGRASGIFSNEIYAGMLLVVAFTTLLAPLGLKLLYRGEADPAGR